MGVFLESQVEEIGFVSGGFEVGEHLLELLVTFLLLLGTLSVPLLSEGLQNGFGYFVEAVFNGEHNFSGCLVEINIPLLVDKEQVVFNIPSIFIKDR